MNIRTLVCSLGCLVLAVVFAAPSHAGLDVDFGASVRLGNDADLYFAISSRYFDKDRTVVERWGARYENPDDLAVSLFIGQHSGASPRRIFDLRHRGLDWWEISLRLGVPMEAWFLPVRRDPGPPYGRAYGHWKNHRSHHPESVKLSDAEMGHLVAVRMLHEYYAVPVEVAMDLRASGRTLDALMCTEYEKRHGNKPASPGEPKGKSTGHGKSHGKSQGHGKHRN